VKREDGERRYERKGTNRREDDETGYLLAPKQFCDTL
jgi:hypothetical protein